MPNNATDLLVSAVAPKPNESVIDPACGAGGFLASVVRYYVGQGLKNSDMGIAVKNLWGIEKDSYLAKLARLHVSLLSGGHPNVLCGDSLAMKNQSDKPIELPDHDGFDVVLINPPFGAKIVAATRQVLQRFLRWRRFHGQLKCLGLMVSPGTLVVQSTGASSLLFLFTSV